MWADPHPYDVEVTIAYAPIIIAPVTSTDPSTSTSRPSPSPLFSRTHTRANRNVSTPIGTLMKKIQCQSIDWVISPPAISPIEAPLETTNMYTLIAFARSAGCRNSVAMIATIADVAPAPPRPCRNRAAISMP